MATYKIKGLIELIGKVRKNHILDRLEQAVSEETDTILGQADAAGDYAEVLAKVKKYWDDK